ncbi:MAG: copper chaperone PCu(A)C [Pseudomonadaceae bacterium]|nr:copper chaperone PCu(A)C [Pseudomonadaceae bacterium]
MFPFLKVTRQMFLVIMVALACSGCTKPVEPIAVSAAQVRDLVPGRDTTAGYFVLTNNTTNELTLTGATSELARAIEMHKTVQRENSVGMQRVSSLAIAPNSQVRFERGGLHLMIFGVAEVPDNFPVTLQFSSGEQLPVTFSKLPL